MYDYRHFLGDVQQEAVAHHLALPFSDGDMLHDGEVVRVQSFDGQPPGVVVEIVLPGVQLAFVHEELVTVAAFEERGASGFARSRNCGNSGRHCSRRFYVRHYSRRFYGGHPPLVLQLPPGFRAARLEAPDYQPQVLPLRHVLLYPHYHVDMVGHDAELPYLYHGIEGVDLSDLLVAYCPPQCRLLHGRRHCRRRPQCRPLHGRRHRRRLPPVTGRRHCSRRFIGGLCRCLQLAQQRLPPFDDEGQHVGALSSVVVPGLAPVHAVPGVADLDASRYRFFFAPTHLCFLIVMQMYS